MVNRAGSLSPTSHKVLRFNEASEEFSGRREALRGSFSLFTSCLKGSFRLFTGCSRVELQAIRMPGHKGVSSFEVLSLLE